MDKGPQKDRFTVRDLPSSERPRERLQKLGASSLSAAELLAVVMGRGIKGESVLIVTQRLLDKFKDVRGLAGASVEELSSVRGIGLAKACQITAAFELANRWDSSTQVKGNIIKTPEDAYSELKGYFRGMHKECFRSLFLDTRSRVIKSIEVSVGSLDSSIVHPRELFKEAIAASSASFIAAHNHPSGNPEPSQDDIRLSKRLKEAGDLVGIEMIDHIIIGDRNFFSLKREGLL